jgi:RNA polymerase sigma factor (sigma-70 family)
VVGRPPDDRELARRAKAGDVDAYASLLRLHEGAARRLALVLCGSSADPDDAAQEAFIKAWYALPTFDDGAPFRPWMLRIVANEARNRRRSAGRRARYELRCAEDRVSGETALSPEVSVLAADRRRILVAALAELPPPQRDVVACRYVVGLDEHETASALGLPVGTVKSRCARGLSRLRRILEIGGDGNG